jgi:hypothetical protein
MLKGPDLGRIHYDYEDDDEDERRFLLGGFKVSRGGISAEDRGVHELEESSYALT